MNRYFTVDLLRKTNARHTREGGYPESASNCLRALGFCREPRMRGSDETFGSVRSLIALALMMLLSATAYAQEPGSQPSTMPARSNEPAAIVAHVPPASLNAGEQATIETNIKFDWKIARAWLHVRPLGASAPFEKIQLLRSSSAVFAALIPKEKVQPPGLEYFISSEDASGNVTNHFGSEQSPYPVLVQGETAETKYLARLAAVDGKKAAFFFAGEFTAYGSRLSVSEIETVPFSDRFWDVHLEYHYRFLQSLYDIRFGAGILRGQHQLRGTDGLPFTDESVNPPPGLNYGFGEANFEHAKNLSTAMRLTLGADARGVVIGVGGTLRIGRIAGTHLALNADFIQDVGTLGSMKFAWHTIPRVPMSLSVELNDRPDSVANSQGTRSLLEVGFEATEQITLSARIGSASRTRSLSGGFLGGLSMIYEY